MRGGKDETRMFHNVSGQSQRTEVVAQTHNRALKFWVGTKRNNRVLTANGQSQFQKQAEVSRPEPTWVGGQADSYSHSRL